jgi:hypothetical protein
MIIIQKETPLSQVEVCATPLPPADHRHFLRHAPHLCRPLAHPLAPAAPLGDDRPRRLRSVSPEGWRGLEAGAAACGERAVLGGRGAIWMSGSDEHVARWGSINGS